MCWGERSVGCRDAAKCSYNLKSCPDKFDVCQSITLRLFAYMNISLKSSCFKFKSSLKFICCICFSERNWLFMMYFYIATHTQWQFHLQQFYVSFNWQFLMSACCRLLNSVRLMVNVMIFHVSFFLSFCLILSRLPDKSVLHCCKLVCVSSF